ncbi:MAG: hypothetical protein ABI858_05815 [Pseudoxanthomonas sp.]
MISRGKRAQARKPLEHVFADADTSRLRRQSGAGITMYWCYGLRHSRRVALAEAEARA